MKVSIEGMDGDHSMWDLEEELWQKHPRIAGVDEVGRGALLGDVVAACVLLPTGLVIDGVDDSKRVPKVRREKLADLIRSQAIGVGIGRVDVATIDEINIKQASRLAMKRAVEALPVQPDLLLVDFESIDIAIKQQSIVHGDALSHSIAAASIVAKVLRDALCKEWDAECPGYGIGQHKGYATAAHREAIVRLGASRLHRKTFLRKILDTDQLTLPLSLGDEAV